MKFFRFLLNSSSCLFLMAICLRVSIQILKKRGKLSKFKKLKTRKTDRTVGLNFCISGLTSSGNEQLKKKRYNLNNQDKR